GDREAPRQRTPLSDGRKGGPKPATGHRPPHRADPAQGGPPIALIVDAGPLYAYVDEDDRDHEACLAVLANHPGPLVVPLLVVAEVAHLVGSRIGAVAEVRFIGDLAAGNLI